MFGFIGLIDRFFHLKTWYPHSLPEISLTSCRVNLYICFGINFVNLCLKTCGSVNGICSDSFFSPFLAYFLEIYEITEAQNCRSNFQKPKSRVDLHYNSVSLRVDHQDFIHLAQQDSCLTWSVVQALCDPEQNNEYSCSANDFVFSKIIASLLGGSIPENSRDSRKNGFICTVWLYGFIFTVWLYGKISFYVYILHKFYLVEFT